MSRLLLALLVAAAAVAAVRCAVAPPTTNPPLVTEFSIDGTVEELVWLNTHKNKTVLVRNSEGSIFRSKDAGKTWSSSRRPTPVSKIYVNPVDHEKIFLRGDETIHYASIDGGNNFVKVDFNLYIDYKLEFHPTDSSTVLFSSQTAGCRSRNSKSVCSKELYITRDFFKKKQRIASHIVEFAWSPQARSDPSHKDVIFVSKHKDTTSSQQFGTWNPDIDLVRSSDFFATPPAVVLARGNKFTFREGFLFVAVVDPFNQVSLSVSTDLGSSFLPAKLPTQLFEHSYTILDTSEGSVFLHVNHDRTSGSRWGTIYRSDATGSRFTLSLKHNVRDSDGFCDFAKVEGVEGIYLANWVENADSEDSGARSNPKIQTAVTFDKGSQWHLVAPPKVDSNNKVVCKKQKKCYLHLHGVTSTDVGPFYSHKNALGLILANGNVGASLSPSSDDMNVYLSRDAGLQWMEIAKGPHTYEFGDHGAIIVFAPTLSETSSFKYTWTEGLVVDSFNFTTKPIHVKNIVSTPESTSQSFILYGTRKSGGSALVYIDFSDMHERPCEGASTPREPSSDYEQWSPRGSTTQDSCVLGRSITYTRRKRDAPCFNGETIERAELVGNCPCTEADWECDYCYERSSASDSEGGCQLVESAECRDPRENCTGIIALTQGYRLIAGDSCIISEDGSSVDHRSREYTCANAQGQGSSISKLLFWVIGLLFVACVWLTYKKGWFRRQGDPDDFFGQYAAVPMNADTDDLDEVGDHQAEILDNTSILSFSSNTDDGGHSFGPRALPDPFISSSRSTSKKR